jgi:hypothetical protein
MDGYKLVLRVLRSGATSDKLAGDENFSSEPVGVSQVPGLGTARDRF